MPIAIASVFVLLIVIVYAWRGRWDRIVGRHPRGAAAVIVLGMVLVLPVTWYLGSPLLLSSSIDEPAPIAVAGSSPRPSVTAPPDATVSPRTSEPPTSAPTTSSPEPVAAIDLAGSFTGADDFHFARGNARLVETSPGEFTVRLEDFAVRNGPDLFVYLSPSADGYHKNAVELGRLKADRGNQNYSVPVGTAVGTARSVVIWCKQFSVLFGTAPLA